MLALAVSCSMCGSLFFGDNEHETVDLTPERQWRFDLMKFDQLARLIDSFYFNEINKERN